jgi:hypothetical protein
VALKQGITHTYVEGRTQGYLLKLEIVDACDVDENIFVFQRIPSASGGHQDTFSNIASPTDLDVYPVSAPDPGGVFFRRSAVDLVFRSRSLLTTAADKIITDVQQMLQALDVVAHMQHETIITLT